MGRRHTVVARICVKVPLYHRTATTVLPKSGTHDAQLLEDSENTLLDPSPTSESFSQWLFLCHISSPLRIGKTKLEKAHETPSLPPSSRLYQEFLLAARGNREAEKEGSCHLKAQT